MDTGGLALEGGGGIGRGPVLEVFLADGGDRTGQVALLLDAIVDDDRFLKQFGVLFEDDVEDALAAHGEGLPLVADALDGDVGSGGDTQREVAVQVGGCTDTRIADHRHGRADDRLSGGVEHGTADGAVLGEGAHRAEDRHCRQDGEEAKLSLNQLFHK